VTTLVVAMLPGDTFGQTNRNALDFDGSNDKVVISDNNALDMTSNYTLEAWVFPTQFVNLAGIFSKYHSSNANGYFLRLNGTSGGVTFDERNTTANVLTLNAWNHIAAVNNNGTRKLYVNGVEVSLGSSGFTVSANGDPLIIGQDFTPDNGRYFKGKIDEARVWNVVRTQAQIQESYRSMMQGTESGLVAYYRFDQNTAGGTNTGQTTLTNLTSTTGLNGTLQNFGLTGSTSNWVSGQTFVPLLAATTSAGSITATTASSGGNITDDGGVSITRRGLAFGTSSGPTIANFTTGGFSSSTGTFSGQMFKLSPSTTYYVRAYATNSIGTGYGAEVSFTTPAQTIPVISYSSPVALAVGTAASIPLTNMGGVPDAVRSSPFAGGISGWQDGIGKAAQFRSPYGTVMDENGNLYVADRDNNKIRKIVLSTGEVSTIAGSEEAGMVNGTGTAARFRFPSGITLDGNGNLFVADASNHCIRKIVLSTGEVTTFAGSTARVTGSADGTGTAARFNGPHGIVADGNGNLYVSDSWNYLIRKITSAGVVSTLAGSSAYGSADGTGTAASFISPFKIAIDEAGNLYVSDTYNNSIRKVVPSTGVVTTLAGSSAGLQDGTGTSAKFAGPTGLCADGMGNLYVADYNNGRLRKIVIATGVVTTEATIPWLFDVVPDQQGGTWLTVFQTNSILRSSRYSISPDLPTGMNFNAFTGEITGTPTAAMAARSYTVTAQNAAGTATTTLVMSVASAPQATTNAATNVTTTTATLNATVNANGGTTSALTIKYSTVQADVDAGNGTSATVTPTSATGNTNAPVSATISGLSGSTTYYFRVSATNVAGTSSGSTLAFTTAPAPPVISYAGVSSPVTLSVGTAMTPLTISTGSVIEPLQVSTFAGSVSGYLD
jgi:hypothetical protein